MKDGRVVKGTNFIHLRDAGDPVENARVYDGQGADELTFLDITASSERRKIILDVVRRTAEEVFMPLTVGGGIRSLEDIRELLQAGADKVSINTAAVTNPNWCGRPPRNSEASALLWPSTPKESPPIRGVLEGSGGALRGEGGHFSGNPLASDLSWEVFIHGGRTPTGLDALSWAQKMEDYGAGEILLTSMDRDGTQIRL